MLNSTIPDNLIPFEYAKGRESVDQVPVSHAHPAPWPLDTVDSTMSPAVSPLPPGFCDQKGDAASDPQPPPTVHGEVKALALRPVGSLDLLD